MKTLNVFFKRNKRGISLLFCGKRKLFCVASTALVSCRSCKVNYKLKYINNCFVNQSGRYETCYTFVLFRPRFSGIFLKYFDFFMALFIFNGVRVITVFQLTLNRNKTPANAFTPAAEKKIGTRWSFVKKVNE